MTLWSSAVTQIDLYQGHKSSGEERCHLSLLGGYHCSSGRHHHCPLYMMMILNSVIWTLVIGYIHACNGGEPLTELLSWPQSQAIQLTFTRRAGNLSFLAWPPWLKGRLPRWWKPSVWWRGRRKEWVRAIMRYLTHRWACAQVELDKNGEWHNSRATALEKQALAQSRVLKKAAVEVGWVLYMHIILI